MVQSYNIKKLNKQSNLTEYFNKTYSINNELLDLDYTSNKKNIITSIVEYYDIKIESNIINLVPVIKNQLEIRNNKYGKRYDINDLINQSPELANEIQSAYGVHYSNARWLSPPYELI
mgnify:CR=1 FL=1